MIYALLLLFFFLEYVRPTSYVPALLALHLNSIVPTVAFIGSLFTALPATVSRIFADKNTKLILGLFGLVWMSVFTADVQQRAWDAQVVLLGYIVAYWVLACELTTNAKVRGVIVTMVLVHLIVAALNPILLTDPGTRHYIGSGSFLGDGNDFALSLNVIIPLCLFLLLDARKIVLRVLWGVALLVLIAGVVATQSRGGTIGLVATGIYYWSKSTRKVPTGIIGIVVLVMILLLAPSAYFDRISTITDTQEGSAQGRITAWKGAIQMAIGNPLLGVGAAHFGVKMGTEYRPEGFIGSGMTAHSVYFLALGELGLPGLILVIWLIAHNLAENRRLSLEIRSRQSGQGSSDAQLLASMSAAMIAFATAGAFLSALYYPHLYVLCGLLTATRQVARERQQATSADTVSAPPKPELTLHWALQRKKSVWHSGRIGGPR